MVGSPQSMRNRTLEGHVRSQNRRYRTLRRHVVIKSMAKAVYRDKDLFWLIVPEGYESVVEGQITHILNHKQEAEKENWKLHGIFKFPSLPSVTHFLQ